MDKQLLDQLLARKAFHCVYCENLLQPPVMLVEKAGNMCLSCYEAFKASDNVIALENSILTTIVEQLEICCEYKAQGCDKRIKSKNYKKHKEECIYQTMNCKFSAKCHFIYGVEKLVSHSRIYHPDRILKSTDDCFRFFDIQNQKDEDYILETSRGFFVLAMKKSKNELMVLIYDSSCSEEDTDIYFDITFSIDSAKYTQKCKAIKDLKSYVEFDESLRITFDLNSVNNMLLSRNNVNFSLFSLLFCEERTADMSINLVDTDSNCGPDDIIWKQLKCLTCNSYIKSEIYCCGNGHNLCAPCDSKRRTSGKPNCSQCGTSLFYHNISSEKLADLARLPCKFKEKGCVMKIPRKSVHELSCYYRSWDCVINGCTSTFSYPDLVLHLKNVHQVPSGFRCLEKLRMEKNKAEKMVHHTIEYNVIFEFIHQTQCYTRNDYRGNITLTQYMWSVNIIRGYDPEPFVFEIEINLKATDPVNAITLKGDCGDKRTEGFTEKFITLDGGALPELSTRNGFDYKIRVFKAK